MRFLFRSLWGLFVTGLTAALIVLALTQLWLAVEARRTGGGPERPSREQVFTTQLVTVNSGPVDPVMQVFGTVETRKRLELRAGASGQVTYLDPAMQEGGMVEQDQLLAQIDPRDATANYDTQEAALMDAQQQLRDAERDVEVAREDLVAAEAQAELRRAAVGRQDELAERGLGTRSERENSQLAASSAEQAVLTRKKAVADAESAVGAAKTALRRSEIALEQAERALEDTELRADFAGRITNVSIVGGRLVTQSEQLAELIDPEALELNIPLSLDQYGRLLSNEGDLAQLKATAVLEGTGGRVEIDAVLDRAAASVADGSSGREVYARIEGDPRALRPGDFVRVLIDEPMVENAAILPSAALGGDGAVLVANDENRLESVQVELLRRQGDEVVISVPQALEGRRVVAERAPQLGAGIRVEDSQAKEQSPPDDGAQAARGGRSNG